MEETFVVKPCREKGSLEAVPKKERHLNLKKMQGLLLGIGYEVKVNTPFVLIVKREKEVSVFPSGRLLIKSSDPDEVKRIAKEIYGLVSV